MIEPLRLLLQRWKTVFVFAVLGVAAGFAYYKLGPKTYAAQLTVVPLQQSHNLGGAGMGQGAAILSELGLGTPNGSSGYRIAAVLQSRTVTDGVIQKLDLLKVFGVEHIEQARDRLWSACGTAVDKRSDLVAVACHDRDPKLVRDLTATIGELGNVALRQVSTSTATEERRFLEKQVDQARQQVADASQAVRAYQEAHQLVDLDSQSKAVVSEIATLEGERVSKALELSYMRSFASGDEASVAQLERQLGVMEKKLRELSTPPGGGAGSGSGAGSGARASGFFPPASDLPKMRFELEALIREQKVREAIYLALTERLEIARADEVRETSAFQVLDEPVVPTYRIWPKGSKVLPMGLFGGIVVGILFVLVPGWWRGLRARMSEA